MAELIEVRCTETGTWSVIPTDSDEPLSTHVSESAAERAAREHAARRGVSVVIHDRYQRIRELPIKRRPRPTQSSSRSVAEAAISDHPDGAHGPRRTP
jgi:hypothetical protein